MTPLGYAEIVDKFLTAFKEWSSGGVSWKRVPAEWVRKNLDNVTPEAINNLLLEHIAHGKEINQVEETREEYRHHQYHYDFIICVCGRRIYVETTLVDHKMGPIVTVVNVHDP